MASFDDPATVGALLPAFIWISTLGKLLVKKGVITKDEIVKELQGLQASLPSNQRLAFEIADMVAAVGKW